MVKITCSILCFNYGRYLSQSIESCLNQLPGDYELEVFVIDDGSTDDTPEICARYASKIRVVRSANEGFGSSLTKAIQLAGGDYVCLLDADDYFHPRKLSAIAPFLKQGALFVRHGFQLVDPDDKLIKNEVQPGGATSGMCVNRAAALSLLPVSNERLFMPLDQPGKSVYLPEGLTYYRVHPGSMQRNRKAGEWQSRLAAVNRQSVARIDELLRNPPNWVNSPAQLKKLRRESRLITAFCELEAALQLGERRRAFMLYGRYFQIAVSQGQLTMQIPKMFIRTLFCMSVYKIGRDTRPMCS